MITSITYATTHAQTTALTTNKAIRNTHTLLSMTLLFSALTASVSMTLNLPHPDLLLTLCGYFALLFVTVRFREHRMNIFKHRKATSYDCHGGRLCGDKKGECYAQ
jgi:modulator of FtsH protease